MGVPENQAIENSMVSRSIESAQSKIEGHHFDARKYVLEYDEVMNKHREAVYKLRKDILYAESLKEKILVMSKEELDRIIITHTTGRNESEWNVEEIAEDVKTIFGSNEDLSGKIHEIRDNTVVSDFEKMDMMLALLMAEAEMIYNGKEEKYSKDLMKQAEKMIMLRTIDMFWISHLDNMEHLRDSVKLRAYGHHDPLVEYKNEGHKLYKQLLSSIQNHIVHSVFRVVFEPSPNTALSVRPTNAIEKQSQENTSIMQSAQKNLNIGRNDHCWCGSGIKFKKCHGA